MNIRAKRIMIIFDNGSNGSWEVTSQSGIRFDDAMSMIARAWKEYDKPKEPRINDEDARDSVHSWASAQLIYKVRCKKTMRGPDVEVVTFEAFGLYSAPTIEFTGLDADVTDGGIYTIDELCGEDEK